MNLSFKRPHLKSIGLSSVTPLTLVTVAVELHAKDADGHGRNQKTLEKEDYFSFEACGFFMSASKILRPLENHPLND